jgi:hypothetical protein
MPRKSKSSTSRSKSRPKDRATSSRNLTVLGSQTFPREIPLPVRNVVHKFCRTVKYTSAAGGVAANSLVYPFALSDLPGYTEFTTLYDQYMIESVELVLIPSITQLMSNYPIVGSNISVVDYDDSVALASVTAALQYETAQIHPLTDRIVRRVEPRIALQANNANSGASAGQVSARSQYIDSANASVPHYGIKIYLDAEASSGSVYVTYTVYARFWIALRQTR